jgi:hypothetical protein
MNTQFTNEEHADIISCTISVMGMHGQRLKSFRAGFPTVANQSERYSAPYISACEALDHSEQKEILRRVERRPRASVRLIDRQIHTSQMQVWRTFHQECFIHTTANVCKLSNPKTEELE